MEDLIDRAIEALAKTPERRASQITEIITKNALPDAELPVASTDCILLLLRSRLLTLLDTASAALDANGNVHQAGDSVEPTGGQKLWNSLHCILDVALYLSLSHEEADPSLALHLVQDAADVLSISQLEPLFSYIESRIELVTLDLVPGRGKALALLRLCNDLLKRINKAKHAAFSGRILCLLTSVYPMAERSGVNHKGEFNLANVTVFDEDALLSDPMNLDEEDGKEHPPKDDGKELKEFYRHFWSLQSLLANPNALFLENTAAAPSDDTPKDFDTFKSLIERIANFFETLAPSASGGSGKKESKAVAGSKRKRQETSDNTAAPEAAGISSSLASSKSTFFFPKFLTSWNLFQLQLSDPFFRSQILSQCLITIMFLATQTKEKKELDQKLPAINKSVAYPYVLTEAQSTWMIEIYDRLRALLTKTIPGKRGNQMRMTFQVMARHERNWTRWKKIGCPGAPFVKAGQDESDNAQKAKRTRPRTDATIKGNLGTSSLTRIWGLIDADDDDADDGAQDGLGAWSKVLSRRAAASRGEDSLDQMIKPLDYMYTSTGEFEEGIDAAEVSADYTRMWVLYRQSVRREGIFSRTALLPGKSLASPQIGEWELVQRWRSVRDRVESMLSPDVTPCGSPEPEESGTPPEVEEDLPAVEFPNLEAGLAADGVAREKDKKAELVGAGMAVDVVPKPAVDEAVPGAAAPNSGKEMNGTDSIVEKQTGSSEAAGASEAAPSARGEAHKEVESASDVFVVDTVGGNTAERAPSPLDKTVATGDYMETD